MAFQPQPGTFYTLEDLAEAKIAGIHTIRRWIKDGKLKASLVGRQYIITGEDIRDFLLNGSGAKQGGAPKKKTAEKKAVRAKSK